MSAGKKTILITGASKRLGKAFAKAMASDGWVVALHYHRNLAAAGVASHIREQGGVVSLHQADLSNQEDLFSLAQEVGTKEAPWLGLINNAGLFLPDYADDFLPERLHMHMAVNFTAPTLLIQKLAQQCPHDKQAVVLNLLDAKLFGLNPDHYSYTLSKMALQGLTRMAALSYAPRLRVNGIAPGITLPSPGQDKEAFRKSHGKNLLGQSSTVSEVIAAARFLLGASSITGHVTLLDGGAHLAPPRRDVALDE